MSTLRFGKIELGLLAATLGFWISPSHAYTPEQQQACSGDAFRLCGPEIPNVDRVTACMIARKSELSPGCRVFFRAGPEPGAVTAARAGKPLSIRPVSTHKHVSTKPHKHKKPAKPAET